MYSIHCHFSMSPIQWSSLLILQTLSLWRPWRSLKPLGSDHSSLLSLWTSFGWAPCLCGLFRTQAHDVMGPRSSCGPSHTLRTNIPLIVTSAMLHIDLDLINMTLQPVVWSFTPGASFHNLHLPRRVKVQNQNSQLVIIHTPAQIWSFKKYSPLPVLVFMASIFRSIAVERRRCVSVVIYDPS